MSWQTLSKDVNLISADMVNQVYEDINILCGNYDYEEGATISDDLQIVHAATTDYINTIRTTMNKVEADFDILNAAVESLYYDEQKQWQQAGSIANPSMYKAGYDRWVDMLNDLYEIIINKKGVWHVFRLSDCIPTINNKKIVLRGETIGN